MYAYCGLRRIAYDCGENGDAVFIPACPKCGRFVKADTTITFMGTEPSGANARCVRCGPVEMPFEGYYEPGGVVKEA